MLGWHISVYRQANDGASPATELSTPGARLAVWQAEIDGLHWLDELAKVAKVIDLGGNGYPYRYTTTAEHLTPRIIDAPPGARRVWIREASDVLTPKWDGKTVIDRAVVAVCRPDEWLLIEAWDES